MSLETQSLPLETMEAPRKRRLGPKKGGKSKKRMQVFSGSQNKVKIDGKMKKLFRKRARDYNSDDDDNGDDDEEEEEEDEDSLEDAIGMQIDGEEVSDGNSSGEEGDKGLDADEEKGASEDEGEEIQPGITKFKEGCRAFKMAFMNIMKKTVADDTLGPVLSGHKKLVAEKLAEESEQKVRGTAKKEKLLVREKGHIKPANFLDSHEKFLISVATKGVVKLFNAVNKAQNAQKGLNPSREKDAKVLGKRRKQAFLAELHKKPSQAGNTKGSGKEDDNGPAWAPLRDSYMLTSSKLKDWDKMADTTTGNDPRGMNSDSSSDED